MSTPQGKVITSFKFADSPPPPHRPRHEQRVVMRESIPRYLSAQLPQGTIMYNANVINVTASNEGTGFPGACLGDWVRFCSFIQGHWGSTVCDAVCPKQEPR